jgi:hypothetical protein
VLTYAAFTSDPSFNRSVIYDVATVSGASPLQITVEKIEQIEDKTRVTVMISVCGVSSSADSQFSVAATYLGSMSDVYAGWAAVEASASQFMSNGNSAFLAGGGQIVTADTMYDPNCVSNCPSGEDPFEGDSGLKWWEILLIVVGSITAIAFIGLAIFHFIRGASKTTTNASTATTKSQYLAQPQLTGYPVTELAPVAPINPNTVYSQQFSNMPATSMSAHPQQQQQQHQYQYQQQQQHQSQSQQQCQYQQQAQQQQYHHQQQQMHPNAYNPSVAPPIPTRSRPSAPTAAPSLPPNWVVCTTDDGQRRYYWNTQTHQSSWSVPIA